MMLLEEVVQNLCNKDRRNPQYPWLYSDEDRPEPRKDCACDNCFYGRDRLALEILELRKAIKPLYPNEPTEENRRAWLQSFNLGS